MFTRAAADAGKLFAALHRSRTYASTSTAATMSNSRGAAASLLCELEHGWSSPKAIADNLLYYMITIIYMYRYPDDRRRCHD
jgi:hypothetical protein